MNSLSGNPFAEYHQHRPGVTEDDGQWAIAQAALALAFEQRTANLVNAYEVSLRAHSAFPLADLHAQIVIRLGLNGDTK